jgi:hypothetical protein
MWNDSTVTVNTDARTTAIVISCASFDAKTSKPKSTFGTLRLASFLGKYDTDDIRR